MMSTLNLENKTVIPLIPSELRRAFRKMVPFMATEETRPYLCGIYCHYSNGKLTLCATNDHILCEIEKDAVAAEDGDFELIIPITSVRHLIKVMPGSAEIPYILMKVSPGATFVEFDGDNFSYSFKTLDGKYPDYRQLISAGNVKMREGMRAEYLVAALKALDDNPIDISVDNAVNSSSEPHLLTSCKAEGIRCVIMPMRPDDGIQDTVAPIIESQTDIKDFTGKHHD